MTYAEKKIENKKQYDQRTRENRRRIEQSRLIDRSVQLLASKFRSLDKVSAVMGGYQHV